MIEEQTTEVSESSYNNLIHKSDSLIRHTSIIIIATMIANASSLLFHMYMSRSLVPADFGILASFLSIYYVVALPVITIQTVVARYVSNFKIHSQHGKMSSLVFSSLRKIFLFSILGLCIFLLGSGYIGSFLQIPSKTPIVILGLTLAISVIVPVNRGALQGLQWFGHLGANIGLEAIARLVLGICLVYLGFGVNGAVAAVGLGLLVALLLGFIPVRDLFRQRNLVDCELNSDAIYRYFWPVFVSLLFFAVLTNVDVIFVKHFFSPEQAGHYGILSIVGRTFLSVAVAISMAMFPKVSELYYEQSDKVSFSVLRKSIVICILVCGLGILFCLLSPSAIIRLVFGAKYLSIAPLVGLFGIAMMPFALTNIIVNYNLAKYQTNFVYTLILGAILHVTLLTIFHNSLAQVVAVLGTSGGLMFIINTYLILARTNRERMAARSGSWGRLTQKEGCMKRPVSGN